MSRDDSYLYSGQTSQSRRAYKEELRRQKREEARGSLLPSEQVIFELLEKERDNIAKQLLVFIQSDTSEDNLKSTLLALKMYDSTTCVATCPTDLYFPYIQAPDPRECRACHANCLTCSGPTNNNCLTCNPLKYAWGATTCYDACPSNSYSSENPK
jgi:hypothetical protein